MSRSDNDAHTPAEWLLANPRAAEPERLAVSFLGSMERRDLEAAETVLAEGFRMVFPGGAEYLRLQDLVTGAKGRYKWVAKRLTAVESFSGGSETVVWVRGTLYGENVHGVSFSGIRFVDRFGSKGGKLTTQDVWNDLAETGVLNERP